MIYKKILKFPKLILLVTSIILLFSIYFTKNFELDASAETLLLENDPDLAYLRTINKRYGSEDFFILTYEPKSSVNKEAINKLEIFVQQINNLPWVSKTISIINAPLLKSSDEPLVEKIQNLKYITNSNVKFDAAISELVNSPVYKDLIISADKKTFGIIVYLKDNRDLIENINKKALILDNSKRTKLNSLENNELDILNKSIDILKKKQGTLISAYNSNIKNLIKNQSSIAEIRLSGIPMIADDMISFIKKDIIVFGIGVFLFIIFILWLVFKNFQWVLFPLINCSLAIILMIGFLGFLEWKVTVISSNFIALMLILTISMNIHYLVRYIQIKSKIVNYSIYEIVTNTSANIFYPILYAVLTTICAFMSLVFSDIKPVIDFGWMMTYGLLVSFALLFFVLPALILIFDPKISQPSLEKKSKFADKLAYVAIKFPYIIYYISFFIIIFSIYGISKLKVENSFINYFSKTTEIYQGMKKIDEKLGGTTPLELIIKFKKNNNNNNNDDFLGGVREINTDFLGENKENEYNYKYKYWFTKDKIDKITSIHKYLEENPYIGKVLSFSSILQIAKDLNKGNELGTLEMGILYNKIPDEIKKNIISPYISIENDEARIAMRIYDSMPDLRRKELIEKINSDLQNKFFLKKDEFRITGILVIFNNLLQSLFDSQIKTLGFVMLGIFLMFLILFRSLKYALIGTIPNFIAAFFILGFIGFLNIPLDMMTITIAAITIGIAVDNSIHYIYRFREETISNNKHTAVYNCHHSVGRAIISTSITIIFGFSILSFSNFIPTIYFGAFTGLAMITALILVLTLLPRLLIQFSS